MSLLNRTQHIIRVGDHYEAYDDRWNPIAAGDSFDECADRLISEIMKEVNGGCCSGCAF